MESNNFMDTWMDEDRISTANLFVRQTVTIVGGAGHIGLPLSTLIADSGHIANVWDTDDIKIRKMFKNGYPYKENDGGEVVNKFHELLHLRLLFNSEDAFRKSSTIVVTLGTPIDSELDVPDTSQLESFIEQNFYTLLNIKIKPLIILRSTLYPGATEIIAKILERKLKWTEGRHYNLVFAPERIAQNNGFREIKELPQIVGSFNEEGANLARTFFHSIGVGTVLDTGVREAEYAKLMTNMYRYVTFGLANEFYKMGFEDRVDVHKAIEIANFDYPRMNLPKPGSNVGGPCLFKDGKFFLSNDNGGSIINSAHWVNQSMPNWIISKIEWMNEFIHKPNNVLILGEAFKAESDDTRHSLTHKMKRLCELKGWGVDIYDPYTKNNKELYWKTYNVVIVMTPHELFNTDQYWNSFSDNILIIDPWKHLEISKEDNYGIYMYK